MARPLWFVELLKKVFPGKNKFAWLTRVPLIRLIADKIAFDGDYILYLPRDNTVKRIIRIDKSLERPTETILPSMIVHHFIDEANFLWKMNKCICRDSSQCKEYPIDYGCLFLGEAARGINPKLGRPITKQEAHEYIKRCHDAGLVHMIGRNKLDTLWLGVSPGDKLLTICNCCPCCCLWKILPEIDPEIGRKVSKMPGVSVQVTDACVGCGICTQGVCFVNAIHLVKDRAIIKETCRGCGRCVEVCPNQAIQLTIDTTKHLADTVKHIASLVDVKQ